MLKLSNGWTDWHQILHTCADSSGNGHRLTTSRPTILPGEGRGGEGRGGEGRGGEGRGEGRGGMTVIHIVIGMFTSNPMMPQYLNDNLTLLDVQQSDVILRNYVTRRSITI